MRGAVVAVIVASGSIAHADPSACAEHEAAIVKAPRDVRTMMHIGACMEQQGKLASAMSWYRKAQITARETNASGENEAKEATQRLAQQIPRVTLRVAEPDAKVQITGKDIEPSTWGGVELDPGTHELVVRSSGRTTFRKTVTVAAGESQTIEVTLAPATIVWDDPGRGRRKTGYVVGGIGLVGIAGVVAFGLYSKGVYDDPNSTQVEADDAKTRLRYIGTPLFLLSAGALVTGIVLVVTAPGKVRRAETETAIAPVMGDGRFGFAVSGSF